MSSHDKSKLKSDPEAEAHADVDGDESPDNYSPEPSMVANEHFDSKLHGNIAAQIIVWSDSRFTEMSVNVYKLVPKGMAMTTYVPVIVGSYPMPNRKH